MSLRRALLKRFPGGPCAGGITGGCAAAVGSAAVKIAPDCGAMLSMLVTARQGDLDAQGAPVLARGGDVAGTAGDA